MNSGFSRERALLAALFLVALATVMFEILLTRVFSLTMFSFVCLALTRFPSQSGQLYAADLAGAATGCLGVIAALHVIAMALGISASFWTGVASYAIAVGSFALTARTQVD